MCWGPLRSRKRRRSLESAEEVIVTISIYVRNHVGKRISKLAILWYPGGEDDTNLISSKLVSEILHIEIQSGESDQDRLLFYQGKQLETRGYVDLEWSFKKSRTTRQTRFFVVSADDPPFDVLLGRKVAIECGLA